MREYTIERHNWETGATERVPLNEGALQDVIDYLFRDRPSGAVPWLDTPAHFDQRLRDFKRKLLQADAPVARRTWQEEAWLMRQGPNRLTWAALERVTGKKVHLLRAAVAKIERTRAPVDAALPTT